MKIWKASLMLRMVTEKDVMVDFSFGEEEKDFEVNSSRPDEEWCYSKNWVYTRIPKQMQVDENNSLTRVVQGFDRELSESELRDVEGNMIQYLTEYFEKRKAQAAYTFDRKILELSKSMKAFREGGCKDV